MAQGTDARIQLRRLGQRCHWVTRINERRLWVSGLAEEVAETLAAGLFVLFLGSFLFFLGGSLFFLGVTAFLGLRSARGAARGGTGGRDCGGLIDGLVDVDVLECGDECLHAGLLDIDAGSVEYGSQVVLVDLLARFVQDECSVNVFHCCVVWWLSEQVAEAFAGGLFFLLVGGFLRLGLCLFGFGVFVSRFLCFRRSLGGRRLDATEFLRERVLVLDL